MGPRLRHALAWGGMPADAAVPPPCRQLCGLYLYKFGPLIVLVPLAAVAAALAVLARLVYEIRNRFL